MTKQLMQQYCIKFCHKLDDTQVETIWKIQGALSSSELGITQIKERYNQFSEGHMWGRGTCIPLDSQQAETMRSLTNAELWSCRIIVSLFSDSAMTVLHLITELVESLLECKLTSTDVQPSLIKSVYHSLMHLLSRALLPKACRIFQMVSTLASSSF